MIRTIERVVLALVLLAGAAGTGLGAVQMAPGGPPLCAASDSDHGGQESAVDVAQNKARARAKGKVLNEQSSFAEVEARFTALMSYSGTLHAGVEYNGKVEGFGAGNLSWGRVRIEVILRDVTQDTVVASQSIIDKKVTNGVEVVAHNPFAPPVADFAVDLVQGREYAAILRLETRSIGAWGEADFFKGNRFARFGCFEIVPDLVDTDGDSLYDVWETTGIDIDADGQVDLDAAALGADFRGTQVALDPNRKDILVEVDWFDCAVAGGDCPGGDTHAHRPMDAALTTVVAAFANAPVANPVGPPGINLWVQVDEGLPHQQSCDLNDGCLDAVKAASFGTAAERANAKTIAAKKLAYRYNLWLHDKASGNTSSGESDGDAGVTGDDFVVSLGSWNAQTGTQNDQAGTFMHELGHTLGLGHGGGDKTNCKPNYLSIMSYTFQVTGLQPSVTFDYSRGALPPAGSLVEDALDEPTGISDSGFVTFYGPPADIDGDGNPDLKLGAGLGPIDWDFDGAATDSPAAPTDINFLNSNGCNNAGQSFAGTPDPNPDETLAGFNDWAIIKFNFRDSPWFPAGEHEGVAKEEELDFDTAEALKDLVWRAQVEVLHEYAAQVVCGVQDDPRRLILATGLYATTINIHNPNPGAVQVRKKLALTYPPAEQRPGRIYRIGIDTLRSDEALKVDCDELQRTLFEGRFPTPFIEGFVVIQSPESLDVTGVYSTATAPSSGEPSRHTAIDVEPVGERLVRLGRPDLVPRPALPTPGETGLPEGSPGTLYCVKPAEGGGARMVRVMVRNEAPVPADASVTTVEFAGAGVVARPTAALAAGAATVLDVEIPAGCYPPGFSTRCRFTITVDAAAQLPESNEGNNTAKSYCTGAAG